MARMVAQVPLDAPDLLVVQATQAPQEPLDKLRIPVPQDAQERLPK